MELASNLIWLLGTLLLLGTTYRGVRRGVIRLPMRSAVMFTLAICFLLLPAISISDDLLASRQATLPAAAQTWRLASENASVGLELTCLLEAALLLLTWVEFPPRTYEHAPSETWPISAWLARSQRLRPPPAHGK